MNTRYTDFNKWLWELQDKAAMRINVCKASRLYMAGRSVMDALVELSA